MEPLDPRLRTMIDEALPAALPNEQARAKGLAALVQATKPTPAAPPVATVGKATALKLTLVAVAVSGAGALGWAAIDREAPERTAPPTEQTPQVAVQPAAALPAPAPAPPPVPATTTPRSISKVAPAAATPSNTRARTRPSSPTDVSAADTLRLEAALITRAQAALDRDKPREALSLCEMHRSNIDAPQLSVERDAIEAIARCAIDPNDDAAARAFARHHSTGTLLAKVRDRCALD